MYQPLVPCPSCHRHVRAAEAVAYRVAERGAYPQCPHTNTRGYFEGLPHPAEFWLNATLEMMRRCDGVVLVDGWIRSSGARAEHEEAVRLSLPVFREAEVGSARWREWLGMPKPAWEGR